MVEDETDADGDLSTELVHCAVLPSLVANLPCTLCRKRIHSPSELSTAPSAWCVASRLSAPVATRSSVQLRHQTVSMGLRRESVRQVQASTSGTKGCLNNGSK